MSVGAVPITDISQVVADVNSQGSTEYGRTADPGQDNTLWRMLPFRTRARRGIGTERYEHTNLSADVTDANFVAVLIGDVTQ